MKLSSFEPYFTAYHCKVPADILTGQALDFSIVPGLDEVLYTPHIRQTLALR
jgi:hypothetical protein